MVQSWREEDTKLIVFHTLSLVKEYGKVAKNLSLSSEDQSCWYPATSGKDGNSDHHSP